MTSWRSQLGVLVLATAAAWSLQAGEPVPGTTPADQSTPHELLETATATLFFSLPERRGNQLRAELRHPPLKVWQASACGNPDGPPFASPSQSGYASPALLCLRLHVLLCTWLT